MRAFLFCLCICCFNKNSFCQKQWSNWYYDGRNLITFKNGNPENVTNFIANPPPIPPYSNIYHFSYWGKQGISYSDPTTGEMKFIISNGLGYGTDYNNFPNQEFIKACLPDQQSYHIIPFADNPDKFYVLQFQSSVAALLAQETGLQVRCPNGIGLGYSIVDLKLNGGLGDVFSINNGITGGLTEQITLVKHSNGKDVWVIVHPYNTAQYNAYLVTSTGILAPVVTNIGVLINGGSKTAWGTLTASHDGRLLAGCRSITPETGSESDIELFDFNNATGVLSNYKSMPSQGHVLKMCFSPDNTKLYAMGFDENYRSSIVNQWDFNQADVAMSRTKVASVLGGSIWDMQLAPNGKIYLNLYREYNVNGVDYSYLPSFECPNLPQYASNFKLKGFQIPYAAAFPPLINDFINEPPVTPTPSFSIGDDTTICFGSLTLAAPTGWQSYRWNTGETTKNITITNPGTYYVLTGNTGFSCPEAYGFIEVADAAIKLELGKDTFLCPNTPYFLHVPDEYTNISWNNGSNTRDSILYTSSTIIITAKDKNGCSTGDTLLVGRKYYPLANFGNDTTLCGNETLLLKLEPNKNPFTTSDYIWQDNSKLDTFRVSKPGTYFGTVTFQGCTASDTISIQYLSGENFTLGRDTSLCSGDTLLLTAPINNSTYLWNTGENTKSIKVFKSGIYNVRVSNGICTSRDTIEVSFLDRPAFSLGNDTVLCKLKTLQLQPSLIGGNFLWQDGSTKPQIIVNTAGLYSLKYTLNGCSYADSILVAYKNNPLVELGIDTSFCTGQQLFLKPNKDDIKGFLWQDKSTQSEYRVTVSGTYFVTATAFNGCSTSDTVKIKVNAPPVFNLGNDTAVCANKIITLSVNLPQAQLLWNNGSTTDKILVTQPGTYCLKATQDGCSFNDSIIVNFKAIPVLNLGADTTLCDKTILKLYPNAIDVKYMWQDGSTQNYFNVKTPGVYYVTLENPGGCTISDSINVSYLQAPILTLLKDTLICPRQTITLMPSVNTPVKYLWQDGSKLPFLNIKDTGNFQLTVENVCGTAKRSIKVRKGICQLFIPNSFSPNNDNLNDVFRIKYPFIVRSYHMNIYNRFGQQLFSTKDISVGWDGRFKGLPQLGGAYVWQISFIDTDGSSKTLQGTVMLIR